MTRLLIKALGDLHKVFRWADERVFVAVCIDSWKKLAKSLIDKNITLQNTSFPQRSRLYRLNIPSRR